MVDKENFKLGIDVSKWQGYINWSRVKNESDVSFVIHRVGYGAGSIDSKWEDNAIACRNLGIPSGGYWFSYARDAKMAEEEGLYAAKALDKFFQGTFLAYDAEYDTISRARKYGVAIDKTLLTSMAIAFLTKVRDLGFIPVLYTNRDYFSRMFIWSLIQAKVPETRLWWATYTSGELKKNEQEIVDVWQYSSKGSIPGINGNVDLNRFYPSFFGDAGIPSSESFDKPNINVRNFQTAWNTDHPDMQIDADGVDDERTAIAKSNVGLRYEQGWTKKEMMNGYVVRWVQNRLKDMHSKIAVDGIYGPYTKNAVIFFQQKHGLEADGIVGPKTITEMFWA